MLLADDPTPWYNTTLTWGIVAAVIALAALYAAWRAIPARPTVLYFWRFDEVQLVRSDSEAPVELEIRRNGVVLQDPYLVQILLATKGRADIGQDAFSGPIVLDIGAPIVDVLKLVSDAEHVPAPPWEIAGAILRVGPALLARRHQLTFSLLTDGPPTSALTLNNRPRDVIVQAEPNLAPEQSAFSALGSSFAGTALVIVVGVFLQFGSLDFLDPRSAHWIGYIALLLGGLLLIVDLLMLRAWSRGRLTRKVDRHVGTPRR